MYKTPAGILKCPICGEIHFTTIGLKFTVDTRKGYAWLQQYKCEYCQHLLFFNKKLSEITEEEMEQTPCPVLELPTQNGSGPLGFWSRLKNKLQEIFAWKQPDNS